MDYFLILYFKHNKSDLIVYLKRQNLISNVGDKSRNLAVNKNKRTKHHSFLGLSRRLTMKYQKDKV